MKCVLEKLEQEHILFKFLLIPFHRWPHLITYWCFGLITAMIDLFICIFAPSWDFGSLLYCFQQHQCKFRYLR